MTPCQNKYGRRFLVIFLAFLCFSNTSRGSGEVKDTIAASGGKGKATLNGYISELLSPQYNNLLDQWKTVNYLNQRFNFKWTPISGLSFTAELRNRLIYNSPGADTSYYNHWEGFVWHKDQFSLNSMFDRFNLKFIRGKFEITAGRQRINWGQSFVWNPNDFFNSYSYLDFDYVERPGSDAIRIQYYNSFTSSAELAAKFDRENKMTAAGLYRFNHAGWDMQFLGGILSSEDAVLGAGFTGNLNSTSIFGEGTYFRPIENMADTTALLMIDVGCSRTFANNISLQLEALYENKEMNIKSLYNFFEATMDVRRIAFARYNLFGSISYPLTPLLNGSIALMWFPDTGGINGFYTGPSLDLSLGNNLGLTLIAQYFTGNFPDAVTQQLRQQTVLLSFARLKWNF